MNREQKAAVIDEVATQIEGVGGRVRGRLPRHLRAAGRRAAPAAGRGRRHPAGGQEHAHRARGRQGGRRGPEGAARGPDRVHVRARATLPWPPRPSPPSAASTRCPSSRAARWTAPQVTVDEIEAIAKLPARDVLHGQLVGVLASPVTGLVRGPERADRRPGAPARADRRAGAREWQSADGRAGGSEPRPQAQRGGTGRGGRRRRGFGATRPRLSERLRERKRRALRGRRRSEGGLDGHHHRQVDRGAQGHLGARAL